MNSFLNNIDFDKEVTLKEPKEIKITKSSKRTARIRRRLLQLFYFIVVLIFLGFIAYFGSLYIASFCKGMPFNSWPEMIKDYKEGDWR